MITLIIGLLVCVAIAAVIVGMVLIPARREGRELLTARGEDFVGTVRDGVSNVRDKVTPGGADDAGAAAQAQTSAPANPTQSV